MSSGAAASPMAASASIPTPARRRSSAIVYHCHRIGSAKLAIQLAHAGRKASSQRPWEGAKALSDAEDAWPTIGPSALPFGPGWHTPRAMTEDDMAHVTASFTDAAKRAVRVGFDAVELHFAHGYLLHSFVSPLSNKRNDAYGGSFEGRMKFPLEVVRSVRAAVPRTIPLGARITGTDWVEGGLTADDAVAMGKALKRPASTMSTFRRPISRLTAAGPASPVSTFRSRSGYAANAASRCAPSA